MLKRPGRAPLGLILGALALLGGARNASAQIPSDNVIYACVRLDHDGDSGKLVRLVSADEPCRSHEERIQWNVQGSQGPAGPQGPAGEPGPAGPEGPAGPSAAFKQVNLAPFNVSSAPASVGSITFTVPSAGTALVTGTGLCTFAGAAAVALEVGPQITAANPSLSNVFQNQSWVSVPSGESPAYRSIALSRTFTLPTSGTYQVFLNEQRVGTGTALASCYTSLTAFFTATTLP